MSIPMVNGYLLASLKGPGTAYRGPDRVPWDSIDSSYYDQLLPDSVRDAYELMKSDESRGFWWVTCKDLRSAEMFAEFAGKSGSDSELIAVYSPYLSQPQGREAWEEPAASFLGVDIVSIGEWSLIRAMLESRSPECHDIANLVNEAGLLQDSILAPMIERRYRELAESNVVEPIADADSGVVVETVTVYSIPAWRRR